MFNKMLYTFRKK